MATLKIKRDDTVIVTAGDDKGKTGTVKEITNGKVLVSGINMKKKAIRPNPQANEKGGHRMVERPIDYSNVALYDAASNKAVKVAVKAQDDGKRVRVNRASGELIDGEVK